MAILKETRIEDFRAVTMPHLNAVSRAARRLTKDRRAADVLVEEVYLQAWRAFRFYKPETDCRAWLFLILFNKFSQCRLKNTDDKFAGNVGETAKSNDLPKLVAGEGAFG